MPRTITDAELFDRIIQSRIADIHTGIPGKVVSYDKAKRRANVSVEVRRIIHTQDGEPVPEDLPELPDVPVIFLRAGGCMISMPVRPGDTGMLFFCHASPAAWRKKGDKADPGDERLHHPAHAVFLPGLCPDDIETPETDEEDAIVLSVEPSQKVKLGAPTGTEPIPRDDRLNDALDAIKTWLTSHTHPVSGASAGASTDPAPTYGPTACDRVEGV